MKKKIIINKQETNYSISETGQVFNDKRRTELKGTITKDGYKRVQLSLPDKTLKTCLVHRLVAEAFCENPNNYEQVDHINQIRDDNRVENLRWVNNQQNSLNRTSSEEKKKGNKVDLLKIDWNEWKQIENSSYYINKEGCIFNKKTSKTLVGGLREGYRRIDLNGKPKLIHRLVWQTFIGEIPKGYIIDHIDGNRENNSLENLRCITQSENMKASFQRSRKGMKEIKKYDIEGNLIEEFTSITNAAKSVNITYDCLKEFLKRRKNIHQIYHGHIWIKENEQF